MKEANNLDSLVYTIKRAKENNQPAPIFFLGAGASKTGDIPLAGEIAAYIQKTYADNPELVQLFANKKECSYATVMSCLHPSDRHNLLKGYIESAKINVTHLYLAQVMQHDYADYILTVNFDNLMLRALALYNQFPPTYDMAILKDLTTTTISEKSVVYLHGQHHGQWLLNTQEEMDKVKDPVRRIFDSITNKRPWVFVGYSGEDPIFDHIQNLGRFDNGLYWVTYLDYLPSEKVSKFLNTPNTNAHLITGFDSDSFFLTLNRELGLGEPTIIDKPFTAVKEMLDNIVDIDSAEHFKGTKERLEIAKRQVDEAIQRYEERNIDSAEATTDTIESDALKKAIIDIIISEQYDEEAIGNLEEKVKALNQEDVNNQLGDLYFNWGLSLDELVRNKTGTEADVLLRQICDKYRRAISFQPNNFVAFLNWGATLVDLAKTKTGTEADGLLHQAIEKYQQAISILPNYHDAYYNWGTTLGDLAKTKTGTEADGLLHQAIEKFQYAISILPNSHEAYYNWGVALMDLAKTKTGSEAEYLHQQAMEKCKKAFDLGGSSYNLACVYALLHDKTHALEYLELSLRLDEEITPDVVRNDNDWQAYWEDEDFLALLAKYA